jgi:hypothetical protein
LNKEAIVKVCVGHRKLQKLCRTLRLETVGTFSPTLQEGTERGTAVGAQNKKATEKGWLLIGVTGMNTCPQSSLHYLVGVATNPTSSSK